MDKFIKKVRDDGTIEHVNENYDSIVSEIQIKEQSIDMNSVYHPSTDEIATNEINHVRMQRSLEYPPIEDFADAWVKNDTAALEEYRQACLAVKAKYPKPE